jgi:hypothetical protein
VFFAETPGVRAEFAFSASARVSRGALNQRRGPACTAAAQGGSIIVADDIKPGHETALEVKTESGEVIRIVLLDDADSLALWKASWVGRDRVFLTPAGLVLDGDLLRLTSTDRRGLRVAMLPAPNFISAGGKKLRPAVDGVFTGFSPPLPKPFTGKATAESIQAAGPARDIPRGKIGQPVAAAPEDQDFAKAAVWRVKLPANLDLHADPLLRFHYVGDVARVTLNGKLITDDFYNGNTFDIGLRRYAPEILAADLRIEILPLRDDAPIYLAQEARPDFRGKPSVVALKEIEIVARDQIELKAQ